MHQFNLHLVALKLSTRLRPDTSTSAQTLAEIFPLDPAWTEQCFTLRSPVVEEETIGTAGVSGLISFSCLTLLFRICPLKTCTPYPRDSVLEHVEKENQPTQVHLENGRYSRGGSACRFTTKLNLKTSQIKKNNRAKWIGHFGIIQAQYKQVTSTSGSYDAPAQRF